MCDAVGLSVDVEVDGGVGLADVREVLKAGANVIVAGSAVYGGDVRANVEAFLAAFKEVRP